MTAKRSRWSAALAVTGGLAVALNLASGCVDQLPYDQVCDDAGYAVSNRVYDCTGDGDAANARFDWYKDRFTCVAKDYRDTSTANVHPDDPRSPLMTYQCVKAMKDLSCEDVLSDERLDEAVTRACPNVVSRNAGPLPDPMDAGPDAPPEVCKFGEVRSCYTGPPQTQGVGKCKPGLQYCKPEQTGFHEKCYDEVLPFPRELCQPGDDDCDGSEDCGYTFTDALTTSTTTGLVWQRVPGNDQVDWVQAGALCAGLTLEGQTGFRLPTPQEFQGITISGGTSDFFAFTQNAITVWTALEIDAASAEVWSEFAGISAGSHPKTELHAVRCVKTP